MPNQGLWSLALFKARIKSGSSKGIYDLLPFHHLETTLAIVGLGGLLVVLVSFAEDELVVPKSEGVAVEGNGMEVHVGVGALRLGRTAAVEIPHR